MAVRTPLRTTISGCAICFLLCSSFVSIRRTLYVFRSSPYGLGTCPSCQRRSLAATASQSGRTIGVSFPLAWWFLPSLVVVEATPTLAPEPASRHHLAQERGCSEPGLFELIEQHISNVDCGIQPNEVGQREWPHGVARPQHHADVDILFGRESLLKHTNRIEHVWYEQVIDDKASSVLAHNHALSQALTHLTHGFEGLIRGGEGTHELDQLHSRHRIEEVHAQHVAWPLCGCRHLNDGNRARVACQDSVWWADLIELRKQLLLEVQVLDGCFNHQVAVGEVFQLRRPSHPAPRRLLLCCCQLATVHCRLHGGLDAFEPLGQQLVVDLAHEGIVAGTCAHLGDASAHQPDPYDANALNLHSTLLLPLGVPLWRVTDRVL